MTDLPNSVDGGASALRSPNALPVGTRVGEFEIVGFVGEGGFSFVYRAFDHTLHRTVALKEYMPGTLARRREDGAVTMRAPQHAAAFEAGRGSFVGEARLLAKFDHPALVKVFRFWEQNGTAYMVMPLYEGRTLKTVLRESAQPDEAWLKAMLAPLLDALTTLHDAQCFHRDIAPDNILILDSGGPLLLDFGAARRVIGDMTQAGAVIVKPGYAPVEQYGDDPAFKQGPWTDIYALSAVLHFAITGKPPATAVARTVTDPVRPLAESVSGYRREFLKAIDRGLAVRPENRPQSISEFRQFLGIRAIAPQTQNPLAPSGPGVDRQADRAIPAPGSPVARDAAQRDADATMPAAADPGGTATATPDQDGTVAAPPDPDGTVAAPPDPDGTVAAPPDPDGTVAAPPDPDGTVPVAGDPDGASPAPPSGGSAAPAAARPAPRAATDRTAGYAAPDPARSAPLAPATAAPTPVRRPMATTQIRAQPGGTTLGSTSPSSSPRGPAARATWIAAGVIAAVLAVIIVGGYFVMQSFAPVGKKATGAIVVITPPAARPQEPPSTSIPAAAPPPAAAPMPAPAPEGGPSPAAAPAPAATADSVATPVPAANPTAVAPAAPSTARVLLDIKPWGEILVDGRPRGLSPPLKSLSLPEGKHRIEIRNPVAAPFVRDVDVKVGRSEAIAHTFK